MIRRLCNGTLPASVPPFAHAIRPGAVLTDTWADGGIFTPHKQNEH